METGGAKTAAQSRLDRAAWDALDPETRERLAAFVSPEEFTVTAGSAESAESFQRFMDTLDRAEQHNIL
ncbi:hypothetical protein ACH4U6_25185 [Streptomyces netropsis]|uniref:Uncharacterized protein n=1 Tax=Streptomyces netropsis TaxID=55404 RepID=A0A7W7PGU7_STRNE|nr:hypothetical protein [Streptomyces netropsis]MBB4888633.1 hypothetical protein [Streptomyces netropsis]GGR13997.1 hypothetical protein GCM10010219_18450 [Streptomyces netropsis]